MNYKKVIYDFNACELKTNNVLAADKFERAMQAKRFYRNLEVDAVVAQNKLRAQEWYRSSIVRK